MVEPVVWVPIAIGSMKSATAAAEPLDEPAGVRVRSCGLRVGPGCRLANSVVTVTAAGPPNAAYVSRIVSTTMNAGQQYSVHVTMQNTGGTTWTPGALYRLGAVNPYDNTTWGLSRALLFNGESIAPGQQKTFAFTVRAPTAAGTYNFQWRMVQDGVTWFGDFSQNAVITVR